MEPQELLELPEEAHRANQRAIGVTMATVAALLAAVTLMGHRLHTEEVVMQTKSADGWAYYQAKNTRSQMYASDAKLAELVGRGGGQGAAVATSWAQKAEQERRQADDIRLENERRDTDTQAVAQRATLFDGAEVCLEVAIVLCSIALLMNSKAFWRLSFAGTAIGLAMAAFGLLKR